MRAGFSEGERGDFPSVSKGVWYACVVGLALGLALALAGVWVLHKTPSNQPAFNTGLTGRLTLLLTDVFFFSLPLALAWEMYKQARTTWNEQGIGQPKLTGSAFIRWEDVERVKARGLTIRISSNSEKIVINPFFYGEPGCLASMIAKLVPADAVASSIERR